MSILRALERRGADPRAEWGSSVPPPPGQLGRSVAGVQISEQTALQIAAVWGSVDLISSSIATLPIRQWRQVGDEARPMDPAPVIRQPWPEMTARDFVVQGTLSLLLRGNIWGRIVSRDDNLYPAQVQLVHPDHVRVRRDPVSKMIEFRYWDKIVQPDSVTRAMALSVPEGIQGLSPVEFMRTTFGVAHAQALYNAAFFSNSARPDGIISVPGELDPDEAKAMKDSWLSAMQGINQSHLPAVLTEGAQWKPVTMSLADAQFLEQMGYSASVITGMIYRIPPHMLGLVDKTTSWGAGIEQQQIGFVRDTLLIWLARWEDLMTSWLPARQFVTFDLSERLKGDALQRWSAYQIARVIGAMNSAEVRAAEGLPKVTDPAAAALLEAYDTPFTSSPVKPASPGVGGDKAN